MDTVFDTRPAVVVSLATITHTSYGSARLMLGAYQTKTYSLTATKSGYTCIGFDDAYYVGALGVSGTTIVFSRAVENALPLTGIKATNTSSTSVNTPQIGSGSYGERLLARLIWLRNDLLPS